MLSKTPMMPEKVSVYAASRVCLSRDNVIDPQIVQKWQFVWASVKAVLTLPSPVFSLFSFFWSRNPVRTSAPCPGPFSFLFQLFRTDVICDSEAARRCGYGFLLSLSFLRNRFIYNVFRRLRRCGYLDPGFFSFLFSVFQVWKIRDHLCFMQGVWE